MASQKPVLHAADHALSGPDPLGLFTEWYVGSPQTATGFGTTTLDWAFSQGPSASETLLDLSTATNPKVTRKGIYGISVYAWATNSTWDANGYWQLIFSVQGTFAFWAPSIDGVPTNTSPGHAIPIITSTTIRMDQGGAIELQISNRDSSSHDFELQQAMVTLLG